MGDISALNDRRRERGLSHAQEVTEGDWFMFCPRCRTGEGDGLKIEGALNLAILHECQKH
jgi:hypothetical protein